MTPTPPQERTKGDDTAPTVQAHGAITTKINQVVATRATAATIQCSLQPKVASRYWAVRRATGGHHSVHGGRTKKNPCNRRRIRRRRKGVTNGGTHDMGTTDLTIRDCPTTPYHRADPPSPTPDTANPNPNRSGSGSLPQISPLGNRVIRPVIWLPTSTRTQPVVGHLGVVTDARPSDSMVRGVRFCH
jgi:hypothetical protein